MPLIRPSHDDDLAAITAIYAHHVLHGTGTFETSLPLKPTWPRAAPMCSAKRPALAGRRRTGRAGTGFRLLQLVLPRPAYRFSAEDSIYMAQTARHGHGTAVA